MPEEPQTIIDYRKDSFEEGVRKLESHVLALMLRINTLEAQIRLLTKKAGQ
jgi:hypothetical protein